MAKTELFMNLIKHRLCKEDSDITDLTPIDDHAIQDLMHLARRHDLSAIIASELIEQNQIVPEAIRLELQETVCQAACYCDIMNHEIQWICDILEQGQIPHIVLKGGAIRDYYPEPWLRTSGDIDILVQEEMLERAVLLLSERGCILHSKHRYHDIPMRTPANNLLELHFNIREDISVLDSVLDLVWTYSHMVRNKKYQYRQSDEFLIFHLLAHMSYHLIHGGCGIRSFVDIWLLHQNKNLDQNILQELIASAHLTDFYANVMTLNRVWFEKKSHCDVTLSFQELIIASGTFGSRRSQILMEQAQAGSRKKYVLHRIFMPRKILVRQYPILAQHPILLPFCQMLRWVRILIGNRQTAFNEMHTSHSHSDIQIQKTQQILKQIGLNL